VQSISPATAVKACAAPSPPTTAWSSWQTFHHLLDHATGAGLRRRSNGTKWANEQLLFHMLFDYLITRALLPLARIFGRLPSGASKTSAGSSTPPTGRST
jgi:hypothetical protein